ncbi:MAG: aldo/keto reductase [Gemmatimonadaceae bacterium]
MESCRLGVSDLVVSRIACGCWARGGHGWGNVDDNDSKRAIRRAFDLGVNLFDTADVYGLGHSEELLSDALGEDRHHVCIATKGGVGWDASGKTFRDTSPNAIIQALDASLRRLRVDCIPLYQIHWPDGITSITATIEALVRCRDEGKIRWIGCSNFSAEQLKQANRVHPMVALQMPYNLLDRRAEDALLPLCACENVAALAYAPLAQGALSGKYAAGTKFEATDVRSRTGYFGESVATVTSAILERLKQAAQESGRTPAQMAIRWVLDSPGVAVAITGVTTANQIDENIGALAWTLPNDLRAFIAGQRPAAVDAPLSPAAAPTAS